MNVSSLYLLSLIEVLIMSLPPMKKTANTASLIDSFIHSLVGWLVEMI